MEMLTADGTAVGKVTIPPNRDTPEVGQVIEVRYLYFVGSLVQAVYLGQRFDIGPEACTLAQFKRRQEV